MPDLRIADDGKASLAICQLKKGGVDLVPGRPPPDSLFQ
jgi:hypothetical protein